MSSVPLLTDLKRISRTSVQVFSLDMHEAGKVFRVIFVSKGLLQYTRLNTDNFSILALCRPYER